MIQENILQIINSQSVKSNNKTQKSNNKKSAKTIKNGIVNANKFSGPYKLNKHIIADDLNFSKLSSDLEISTITITCKLNTKMNVENIGKYIDISPHEITEVKYGDDKIRSTSTKPKKRKNKTKDKVRDKKKNIDDPNFNNQASLYIYAGEKNISIKIFTNGSLQITGCKKLDDFNHSVNILCSKLMVKKLVYDKKNNKMIKKEFVTNPENLGLDNIFDFKIGMINSNFEMGFMINREKLQDIIVKNNIHATYEPCTHAAVNIKRACGEDHVSIFVFESGSIIITGAKNYRHILDCYIFIKQTIHDNFNEVLKINFADFIRKIDIESLMRTLEMK